MQTVTGHKIGDFLMFYGEDAKLVSKIAHIALGHREDYVCGWPCRVADEYEDWLLLHDIEIVIN